MKSIINHYEYTKLYAKNPYKYANQYDVKNPNADTFDMKMWIRGLIFWYCFVDGLRFSPNPSHSYAIRVRKRKNNKNSWREKVGSVAKVAEDGYWIWEDGPSTWPGIREWTEAAHG